MNYKIDGLMLTVVGKIDINIKFDTIKKLNKFLIDVLIVQGLSH